MANITTRLDKGRKLTSSEIDNNFAELNSELSTKISENSDINVNNVITAGNIVPTADAEYSLGSSEFQWKDLYVSSSTIYIGNVAVSVNEEQNLSIGNAKVVTDQNIGEIVTDLGNIVESINGKTGNVTLNTDDILEGTTSIYFTDTRAVTAIKNDADWNAADWNTAYSWGNHATAGYALSSSLSPVAFSGDYSNLLNTPDLGTASGKNVPSSGDASPDQVVLGNDTRLSDARTPTAHNHNISDITNLQTALDDKVDAVVGKGLSTEDYTTAEKNKLSGIESGAQVNPTVVANLTMESDTLPLAASQGKVLKDYIDDINLILQSDDSTLDELQEIVEYIKLNREELENLGISSIAGLESALDGKQPLASVLTDTTASFTTELKNKLDAIAEEATKNDTDANLKNRANHTGTQDASTITGLATVATSGSYNDLSDKPALGTAAFENSSSFATSTQGSNADAAYGWGDHANAGYALSSSLATVATSGSYGDLSDKPTLGTAASKDAPSDGNATSTQVVLGNDTRLTDARTPTSHTHTAAQVTGLAAVATSGSYDDLSDKPTLGTAAAASTGDFATAAQGVKADTALQPDAIGVTVQGYSAVLNGTTASFTTALKDKLDAIATGATANQTDAYLLNRANHTGTQPASTITGLATVATTGSYDDLDDKPTIPTLPTLAPVATSGSYNDLSDKPTVEPETYAYHGSLGTNDLNNVREPGLWGQAVHGEATVARNYPVEGVPGALEVLTLDPDTTPYPIVAQRYTTNEGNQRVFIRRGGAQGGWSDWSQIASEDALSSKADVDLSNVPQETIRSRAGTGTMAYRNVEVSEGVPTGGNVGDIWLRV